MNKNVRMLIVVRGHVRLHPQTLYLGQLPPLPSSPILTAAPSGLFAPRVSDLRWAGNHDSSIHLSRFVFLKHWIANSVKFVFQSTLIIFYQPTTFYDVFDDTKYSYWWRDELPVSVFEGRGNIKNSPVVGELNKGPWDLQLMALRVKPPRPRSGVGPKQTEKWYSITWQRK